MAIVYQATNTVNGRRYVGVTRLSLRQRRNGHISDARLGKTQMFFHRALRKHGPKAFKWEVLGEYPTPDEAYAAEREFVAILRPEYNTASGGWGVPGLTHSEKTREKLRQHGEARKDLFATFAHLGPAAMAKPVICLDDGVRYESASAAARAYGIKPLSVSQACGADPKRQTAGGKRFIYADGSTPDKQNRRQKLTGNEVELVRIALRFGFSQGRIAKAVDLGQQTISEINRGLINKV